MEGSRQVVGLTTSLLKRVMAIVSDIFLGNSGLVSLDDSAATAIGLGQSTEITSAGRDGADSD
jgi:hypothetical protein